ncbi:MAG: porin family protein [Proteobacteria bacterium]|nr:porin family protein [Pseudomonadota bacterium]
MLKQYVQLIGVLFILLWAVFQKSARGITSVGIEPIVGYERNQLLVPTPHTKDRLVYGARATYGFSILSVEAEYLRGSSTETFPIQDLTTKDTSDKIKVGLRTGVDILSLLNIYARAGCQGNQNRHEETSAGVTTVTKESVKYHPYGGAGIRLRLGRNLRATGDLTTVFRDFPNMNNNDYQITAGFVVQVP